MSEGLQATLAALNQLVGEIKAYMAAMPPSDRYLAPVIDWHHPHDYDQTSVQGLSKFLHHVEKEQAIIEALSSSPSQPAEYTSNLISLEGVWGAFLRAPKPVTAIWQAIDKVPGFKNGNGSMKIDVVGDGGGEWIKVNTIKESRLLVEFREQDSYLNSDWDSDSSVSAPSLTNSLLTNARILAAAAEGYPRTPGLPAPRVRYVLTRLPERGHSDARVGETLAAMRRLGIQLEFPETEWALPAPRRISALRPAQDVVLDLSILIALCCDSTHHPLPADEYELESRFRTMKLADGTGDDAGGTLVLGEYTNATRDLRDQLRCELARPLLTEMMHRLGGRAVRFWITREVRERLPTLVDVIGGERERYRARAMFSAEDFWAGSRWEGKVGANLRDFRVRVLEDEDQNEDVRANERALGGPAPDTGGEAAAARLPTPFDSAVAHVCREMLRVADDTPASATPATTPAPAATPIPGTPAETPAETPPEPAEPATPASTNGHAAPTHGRRKAKASRNPARARAGTRFTNSKLPSGHTLRTLLAGVERGMTVLTNNRGAVLKVLREEGVMEGIPFAYADRAGASGEGANGADGADGAGGAGGAGGGEEDDAAGSEEHHRARIWIVNPSSLAEWRRMQVERANAELAAQHPGARIERAV